MKINDASRSTGISRDMIRYYEKLGLVTPVHLPNGYRDYSDNDLYLLTVIRYLSNLGVPLKVISRAFESGETELVVGNLQDEIGRLNLLKAQIDIRIAAAKESIDCFNMLSSGTSGEIYNAPERYLLSFGSLPYPEYRSGPEAGGFFSFYYRQAYRAEGRNIPQGEADRGLLLYSPLPGAERVPPQPCLRTVIAYPSESRRLLGARELAEPLRQARALTGRTEFTVLIRQFFRRKHRPDAAFLCAEILLGEEISMHNA